MRSLALTSSVLLMLFGVGAPAAAQVTAVAGGNPDHIDLSVPVTASVAGGCGFAAGGAPEGDVDAGAFGQGFTQQLGFLLQCNGALRVAVISTNGALLAPEAAPAGYANRAPYDVTLKLVGDAGVTPVSASCAVSTLTASAGAPCSFRGPATATRGLRLGGPSNRAPGSYLQLSAPPYAGDPLVASDAYSDVLTVTLSASS